jgi:small subunit ribosomal protein S20
MPNLKHAKKALRNQDRKAGVNKAWKVRVKKASDTLNDAIKSGAKNVSESFATYQKTIDKALKNKIMHKNKVDRLKSNFNKKIANIG